MVLGKGPEELLTGLGCKHREVRHRERDRKRSEAEKRREGRECVCHERDQ